MHKMIDFIGEVGLNAGKVWEALNSHGPLKDNQLMENTGLTENDFSAAIGWLSRENKICKKGETFSLGETNLTKKIGEDAGKIWEVFETKRDFFSALGWLAREGKINTENWKTNVKLEVSRQGTPDIQEELRALNMELETRNELIRELKKQLIEKQTHFVENHGTIEDLKVGLEQHQKEVKIRNEKLEDKDKELLKLRTELENKNTEIFQLEAVLKQKNLELKTKNDELDIGVKDILQDNLEKECEDQTFIPSTLCDKDLPLTNLQNQLKQLHQDEPELGEQIEDMKNLTDEEKTRISEEICKILDTHENVIRSKKLENSTSE